jgi:hypothetical protein
LVFVYRSFWRDLCKDYDKGVAFVGEMCTLCGLWKKGMKKGIPIILVQKVFGGMKD